MPDAILVATALLSGCEAIITNDRAWHRRLSEHFPRFQWVYLNQ
jgi:predicted nucleic acid-binding protein